MEDCGIDYIEKQLHQAHIIRHDKITSDISKSRRAVRRFGVISFQSSIMDCKVEGWEVVTDLHKQLAIRVELPCGVKKRVTGRDFPEEVLKSYAKELEIEYHTHIADYSALKADKSEYDDISRAMALDFAAVSDLSIKTRARIVEYLKTET